MLRENTNSLFPGEIVIVHPYQTSPCSSSGNKYQTELHNVTLTHFVKPGDNVQNVTLCLNVVKQKD